MATDNETPDYGVTNDMLDGLLGVQVAAAQRRIAADEARDEWPANVNEVLRLLAAKVGALEERIARLEAGRG